MLKQYFHLGNRQIIWLCLQQLSVYLQKQCFCRISVFALSIGREKQLENNLSQFHVILGEGESK